MNTCGSRPELRVGNGLVPLLQHDFEVPGVGGGSIVVNPCGDFLISVAEVDVGVIGDRWESREAALKDMYRNMTITSEKCTATTLGIGGAGIVLYLEIESAENRKLLWSRLAQELPTFTQRIILRTKDVGIRCRRDSVFDPVWRVPIHFTSLEFLIRAIMPPSKQRFSERP